MRIGGNIYGLQIVYVRRVFGRIFHQRGQTTSSKKHRGQGEIHQVSQRALYRQKLRTVFARISTLFDMAI